VALLDRVNADGTALVIVTHDGTLAQRAQRILTMRDGTIVDQENGS
jgi:predicted ABC-type transport system involved in lysophospholipase L1 biosynthesis ATPase subunit